MINQGYCSTTLDSFGSQTVSPLIPQTKKHQTEQHQTELQDKLYQDSVYNVQLAYSRPQCNLGFQIVDRYCRSPQA